MSYGYPEVAFDCIIVMKQTLNVLNANKHLSHSLEAEAMVLNAKIIEFEKDIENIP